VSRQQWDRSMVGEEESIQIASFFFKKLATCRGYSGLTPGLALWPLAREVSCLEMASIPTSMGFFTDRAHDSVIDNVDSLTNCNVSLLGVDRCSCRYAELLRLCVKGPEGTKRNKNNSHPTVKKNPR
jgi:hypothetical protein